VPYKNVQLLKFGYAIVVLAGWANEAGFKTLLAGWVLWAEWVNKEEWRDKTHEETSRQEVR